MAGRGEKGETLVETLVSVLIGALSMLMLAVALAASQRMIASGEKSVGKYYDGNESIVAKETEPERATAKLTLDGGKFEHGYGVMLYENGSAKTHVISYERES
jgi:hypothetical protein